MSTFEGFEDLYRRKLSCLLLVARSVGDGKEDAEDDVQEAFMAVMDWRELRSPEAYLRSVVRNKVIGRSRKKAAARKSEPKFFDRPMRSVEESYLDEELRTSLKGTLSDLRPGHRALLEAVAAGESAKEIAEAMGRSEHSVACELTRAKHALRGQLRRRGLVPGLIPGWFTPLRTRLGDWARRLPLEQMVAGGVAAALVAGGPLIPHPSSTRTDIRGSAQEFHDGPRVVKGSATGLGETQVVTLPESKGAASRRERDVLRGEIGGVPQHLSTRTEDGSEEPALTPQDQLLALATDPENIPGPECGGLPVSCDQYPLDPSRG